MTMNIKRKTVTIIRVLGSVVGMSLLSLCLAACSTCKPKTVETKLSEVELARAKLKKEIEQERVRFIRIGQTVKVILYSDYLFQPGSANIYKDQMHTLSLISRYISTYPQSEVHVRGYTAAGFSQKYLRSLSKRRAEEVLNTLWKQGIDTRLLIANGLGLAKRVNTNKTVSGRFSNNRIEITFMYRDVAPLYD
jgi:outer membrane protein OmpA-like peptidoglycan-associated protein